MRPTDLIDRLTRESIDSLQETWVIIDSDEHDQTAKMKLVELMKALEIPVPDNA